MQILSVFMQSAGLFSGGNLWIYVGLALAACVLGVEVACICLLVRKLRRASRRRRILEEQEEQSGYTHYNYAAFFAAAALPLTAQGVLALLIGLVALGALVLLVLLIAVRAAGYDFVSADQLREIRQARASEPPAAAPEPAPEAPEEPAPAEAAVADAVPEEPAAQDEPAVQEPDEPAPAPEEPAGAEDEPAAATAGDMPPAAGMAPVGEPAAYAANAGGTAPYHNVLIQKEVTETETVREVQHTAPPAADSSLGEIKEMFGRIMDKMEGQPAAAAGTAGEQAPAPDPAAPAPAARADDGAAVADPVTPADEDDEEDEDENETDAADREDDDFDDEPDDPEHFTGNEKIIGFDEATGYYIVAHYRKSFEAKLIQARPNIKHYYSELKNALLAYGGNKSRISWAAESFFNGRTTLAKINVKTRTLELYLALDPWGLEGTVYHGLNVGHTRFLGLDRKTITVDHINN